VVEAVVTAEAGEGPTAARPLPPPPTVAAAAAAAAFSRVYMISYERQQEARGRWCIPPRAVAVVAEPIHVGHYHGLLLLLLLIWNCMLLPRRTMPFIIAGCLRREGGRIQQGG
jgi:hypothetical protein